MMETVTKPKPFVAAVVYEFYENLSSSISVVGSPQFQKVYVRGHVYDFIADLINEYFGIKVHDSDDVEVWLNPLSSDDELDMDKVAIKLAGRAMVWKAGTRILCSQLTLKYTMLARVGLFNWFPLCIHRLLTTISAVLSIPWGKGWNSIWEIMFFVKLCHMMITLLAVQVYHFHL